MSDIAIRVENLGKKYRIGAQRARYKTIRETIVDGAKAPIFKAGRVLRGQASAATGLDETFWALKDVSFEVKRGEVVGVIGRNGAGKSTLLKILSRITEPTEGDAWIHGRVGSLLEVGTGFHPELTGRENIYLNGTILGMKRTEIDRKFDEIVEFSGIEQFIDTPVKHYSSGMHVRLAFSVAAHLEPEVLLVDEVLAVGDAAFQKKCLGKMGEVAQEGRTILFVSHNMAAIQQLCPTGIWIDEGSIKAKGAASNVASTYLRISDKSSGNAECRFESIPEKEFQLRVGKLLDPAGNLSRNFKCDAPVQIELICQVRNPVPGLYGYLSIARLDGIEVLVSDSYDVGTNSLDGLPIGSYSIRIVIPARSLGVGDYSVYINFTSQSGLTGFNIDSPGTILTFRLNDHSSRRGNMRLGFFSTLLPWEVRPVGDE